MANKSHWIYWFCCQCHDGGHSPYTTACTDCYHTRCTRCQLHRDKPVPLKRGPTDLQRQEDHSIKAYISQKANIILRDISLDTLKSNHGALSRLTKGLPHMLQTLAIRLAALTEIEPSEDLLAQSRTISQHRQYVVLLSYDQVNTEILSEAQLLLQSKRSASKPYKMQFIRKTNCKHS
jgi:hypothetical protein